MDQERCLTDFDAQASLSAGEDVVNIYSISFRWFHRTIYLYSEHLNQVSYLINQGSRTYIMVIQLLIRTEK